MNEFACQFGEQNHLNGVFTRPGEFTPAKPVVVLVTAGFTPKSGPFRLYTLLARTIAGMGLAALRFDLGGIGNSEQIDVSTPLKVRTRCDINAALDYLQGQYGCEQFILCGLCSGAEDSFRYAESDVRVKGVALIDPHAYITKGWHLKRVFSRYFLNRIINKLVRSLGVSPLVIAANNDNKNQAGSGGDLIDYQYMEHAESSRILCALIERGTRLHYLYTGGAIDTFNHKGQFRKMFPGIDFKGLVTLSHIPHIEHTQVFEQDRREVIDTLSDWLSSCFQAELAAG